MRLSFAAVVAAIVVPLSVGAPASGHTRVSHSYSNLHRAPPPPAVLAWLFGDPRRSPASARSAAAGGPDSTRSAP